MVHDLFKGPTPPLQTMEDLRRSDIGNWTYCIGCQHMMPYADSWCPCVDKEKLRMEAEVKKFNEANPNHQGFICFEGVMPMRAQWKALQRLQVA